MNPGTLAQVLVQGLAYGGVYALLAMGLTLMYAVSRALNIAHGNFLALCMYLLLTLSTSLRLDPYVSVFITVPVFFGLGLLFYRYFYHPLQKAELLLSFQAMIALVFILTEGTYMIWGGNAVQVPSAVQLAHVRVGSMQISLPLVLAAGAAIVVAAVLYLMLKRTDLGHQIRAIAQRPELARLIGINVVRVEMLVFGMAFVLVAIAASFVVPFWTVTPEMGFSFALFAFIVLVVGGMGNFLGALAGGFLVGVATAFSQFFLGGSLGSAIPYVIFVLVLIFKPKGLMGTM